MSRRKRRRHGRRYYVRSKWEQFKFVFSMTITIICSLFLISIITLGFAFKINNEETIINVNTTDLSYRDPQAKLFGIIPIKSGIKVIDKVQIDKPGNYSVVYETWWSPLHFFYKKVRVIDTESPQLTLSGSKEIYITNINNYEEPGFSAWDNSDGDITEDVRRIKTKISDSLYRYDYSISDSSDNISTDSRMVYICSGLVYLTFDDGPSNNITPKILDLLKEKDVKATFFVLNYDDVQGEEDLIVREASEGHTVAMHGYSHEYSEVYQSADSAMNNYYILEGRLKETIPGYNNKYIRFPGGSSNTVSRNYCVGVMTDVTRRATDEGYIYFDWNVDSGDSGNAKTADEIYENVVSTLIRGRTNVVLMHDSASHEATYEALSRIIDYCIENGYILKAINEDTVQVFHGINN